MSYVCTHTCVLSMHNKDTHGHMERCEVALYLTETEEYLARLNTETRFRKNSRPEYILDIQGFTSGTPWTSRIHVQGFL